MKTLIIAEAGVNHNGSLTLAKTLVAKAAEAGADIVKFQSFITDKSISADAPKAQYQKGSTDPSESQFEMVRKLELSRADHVALIEECGRNGIEFLSTAFDIESFDMLVELGIDLVKIPSGEITNLPFLRHVASTGRPVILSTGMATLGEIESALDIIEQAGTPRNRITLLHCSTEYPTPMPDVNLRAMTNMKHAFGVDIGYSDHTLGIEVSIAAVALGAEQVVLDAVRVLADAEAQKLQDVHQRAACRRPSPRRCPCHGIRTASRTIRLAASLEDGHQAVHTLLVPQLQEAVLLNGLFHPLRIQQHAHDLTQVAL